MVNNTQFIVCKYDYNKLIVLTYLNISLLYDE